MILPFSELSDRALVYIRNKNADKTHPSRIPIFVVPVSLMIEDTSDSIRTYGLPVREEIKD